jgi:hypothetical protein
MRPIEGWNDVGGAASAVTAVLAGVVVGVLTGAVFLAGAADDAAGFLRVAATLQTLPTKGRPATRVHDAATRLP